MVIDRTSINSLNNYSCPELIRPTQVGHKAILIGCSTYMRELFLSKNPFLLTDSSTLSWSSAGEDDLHMASVSFSGSVTSSATNITLPYYLATQSPINHSQKGDASWKKQPIYGRCRKVNVTLCSTQKVQQEAQLAGNKYEHGITKEPVKEHAHVCALSELLQMRESERQKARDEEPKSL